MRIRTGQKNKAKDKAPARREVLALRPLRNPLLEWVEEDDQVILHIKREQGVQGSFGSWKARLLSLFVPLPKGRRVALDMIGAHVWRMMDGRTTVAQIAKSLAAEYQLTAREAEISLQQFFKVLGRRGYIVFLKEGAEAPDEPSVPNGTRQVSAEH